MLPELIMKRDYAGVKSALDSGANPNAKDNRGNPPLVLATATDQYLIANLLLQNGADMLATDDFGLLPAILAQQSRVLPESSEGAARQVFINELQRRGHPWPPPDPVKVTALKAEGRWPPPRTEAS